MTMTAEQLEELLGKVTQNKWFRVRQSVYTFDHKKYENNGLVDIAQCESKEDADLVALAPSLARRVLAAEKLVEALTLIKQICNPDGDIQYLDDSALTAYREASK